MISRDGHSEGEEDPEPTLSPEPLFPIVSVQLETFTASFEWLASQRACLMKSVLGFMKGFYRSAMRVALVEIDEGRNHRALLRTSRGWKLFLASPRLLLHRPARGGQIPKVQLQRRIEVFSRGDSSRAAQGFSRRRRRVVHDDVDARAACAEALVQLGELSAARQALEGASVAPGNTATLAEVQGRHRRFLPSNSGFGQGEHPS